jgi:HSP20 family protein
MITLNRIQRVIQPQQQEHSFLSAISDWQLTTCPGAWKPAIDVFENSDDIVIRMEIAGMKESDFSITIAQRTIVISGCRIDQSDRQSFHRMEIFFGEFRAEVELNIPFQVESAQATYADGFLQICLPKR